MAGLDPDLSSYNGYAASNALLAKAGNDPANANAWLQNGIQSTQLQQQQLSLSQAHMSAMNDIISSVMADPSPDNATTRIQQGIRMGVIPADEGAKELGVISSFNGDPAKIKQYAFQAGQTLATIQQRQAAAYGTPGLANNGSAMLPITTREGPQGGVYPAGGNPLPMQQSPADLAAPVTVKDQTGQEHTMTQGQFQSSVGAPPAGASGSSPYAAIAGGAKVVNGKIVYTGAAQPAAPAQPGPQATAAPVTGALPGIAGPAPGVTGAADATAQAGAAMGNQLTAAADKATDRRATLSNLQADLGKIATGPNAEAINTMKAGANALADVAGMPAGFRFDPQTIAASEQFRKNAQILANQQQQALGGTDAALAAGQHSNPNLDLSTLGNKQVLATLQGNEDAIQVKNAEWQKWLAAGNSPATYPQFAAKLNQTFSPRAFQFAHMAPAERADMVKTMNPQDRAALAGALTTARQNGWINPGGQ